MSRRAALACALRKRPLAALRQAGAGLLLALPLMAWAQAPTFTRGDDGKEYFPFVVDEDGLAGPMDQSGLNRALDASSRLFVRNARLFSVGADGKPFTADDVRTRLYGVNLSFGSNFPSAQDAPALASRLRKLGMNAVRLHHMDSFPTDDTTAPGSLLTTGPFPTFNRVALTRLSGLITALSEQGIYVNLNLHVGYRFRPDVDKVPAPQGPPGEAPIGNPLHVYHPRLIQLQEQYARELIRALRLRSNPALAMVEINNESSLLAAWQWRKWEYAVPGGYAEVLEGLWQQWLVARYGSTARACEAWQVCANPSAPIPLLMPADADIASTELQKLRERMNAMVSRAAAYLPGASPAQGHTGAVSGKARRTQDFLQFLADTDKTYFDRMRAVVKAEVDALVPVTGTQMAYGGALNFDSQSGMDYIDEHIYVGHPDFPAGWNPRDWRIRDVTPSAGPELHRLLALAFRRDRGKPFVVSEYSQPYPNPRGSETVPVLAAIAAQQDWDGLFYFDYTFDAKGLAAPSNFSLSGDWGKYALTGPSAWLFRQAVLPGHAARVVLPLPSAARQAIAASPAFDALDSHVTQTLAVSPELPLRAQVSMDPGAAPAATVPATPATGMPPGLNFDAGRKRLVLQSPHVIGVWGSLGGDRVQAGPVSVSLAGKTASHASLLLTPVDGQPLAGSRHLLLSLGNWTTGTQAGSRPPRPKELVNYKGERNWLTLEPDALASHHPSGSVETSGPAWVQRASLRVSWPGSMAGVRIYPLDGKGRRLPPLGGGALTQQGNEVHAELQATAAQASLWYEIVLASALGAQGKHP